MATTITSVAELVSAAATLHDARFTADALEFDAAARRFVLKCWVLEPKPPGIGEARRWRACRLSFEDVEDCSVKTNESVADDELATIRFSKRARRVDLVTHYAIDISLTVGKLNGALTETSETRDKWEGRNWRRLGQLVSRDQLR